ncbi:MAG: phospholipase D-like domain-containing protein, partial [Ignavibacteria bacterium]|nr:phospholipase D-like domain-containing protein [Ignavibacteria bacterium]
IQEADYKKEIEEGILQLIDDILSRRVCIKIHPNKNIHAKVYIFREEHKHPHGYGVVITGSSNLTIPGLEKNFEINVELRDNTDIDFATETFEKLWSESVDLDLNEILSIKKETYLNEDFTPYQVYLKFLVEYFGTSIDFDPNSITDLPKGFKRLAYQIDAVNDGFKKLLKHNGFFLADVVGLGKTIVSIIIAKKFYFYNGFPSYRSNTLVVCPPALKENWFETKEKFELDNCDVITNGSLHKIKNPEKYDLIIVDEAHKFRSDTADMYNKLQILCKSPTRKLLPNGEFEKKKVILVSATPLNNKPEDIANQIYLFQDSRNSSLEVSNLQSFFRKHIDEYNKLKKVSDIRVVKEKVKQIYENIRVKVLEQLIVRRTRTDLKDNKQYSDDLIEQGIFFPKVITPRKILYKLEPALEKLYDYTISCLSQPTTGLTYNRYRAIAYLKPEKKKKYKSAELVSFQLAVIMKILLVKRIDSSFHAFKQSLKRFSDATDAMVKMFEKGKIYIAPNLGVTEFILEDREDDLIELIL